MEVPVFRSVCLFSFLILFAVRSEASDAAKEKKDVEERVGRAYWIKKDTCCLDNGELSQPWLTERTEQFHIFGIERSHSWYSGFGEPVYQIRMTSKEEWRISAKNFEEGVKDGNILTRDPAVLAKEQRNARLVAAQRRTGIIKAKNWPANTEKAVIEGKVHIGMTEEQVIMSWGRPRTVNKSVGSWGTHEQWVYGSAYLYLQNGLLTSYQTSK